MHVIKAITGKAIQPLIMAIAMVSSGYAIDTDFYYSIGGGTLITPAPTTVKQMNHIGVSIEWGGNLLCGDFDIEASVKSQLNGLTGSYKAMMGNTIKAATGAIANLPVATIAKSNPVLYDTLQNGVLQAKQEFELAQLNCEEITQKMHSTLQNKGWRDLSLASFWKKSASSGVDILTTRDNADTQGGDLGVPWIGGQSQGGKGQNPISIIKDVAMAGYNILLNRKADNTTAIGSACNKSPICERWTNPKKAAEWLTDVIGDKLITTCDGCNPYTVQAGMGINHKYDEETQSIANLLSPLISGNGPPKGKVLDQLSQAAGYTINRKVIEAIRREPNAEVLVSRVAGEIAMSKTLDDALSARRMLLSGMKEPNVANNAEAKKELQESLDELTQEIDNIAYEMDMRQRLASNTYLKVLGRDAVRNSNTMTQQGGSAVFREGTVQ
jgi:integrating conjugative element protein (TIGR03755 family)